MRKPVRAILLSLVLAGVGVFFSGWLVTSLLQGSYLTGVILTGWVVWAFGMACHLAYTVPRTAKLRAEYGPTGTLVRSQKNADVMFGVPTFAIFLAAVLYLTLAPFGMIDYVPAGTMRIILPAGLAFLVVFGVPTLYRIFKHGCVSYLWAGPSGFEVWNGQWGSFSRGTWDEVEQVLDSPPRGRKPYHEVVVLVLPKGRSATLVADAITGNSGALREWVRFYWQHPECRAELTDARGLRRLD